MLDTDTCICLMRGESPGLAVLDWPQEAAQHYAEIRAALKRRGAQLGAADLMIAAHARAMGAIIVTNNVKDFGRVKGLQVENWTKY
jgi:tRNA(fMet)-specific endonuclease VapC